MKAFITGASGFIGQAVVPEFVNNGHQVLALARSEASASALEKAGASVIRGDLTDSNVLKEGAKQADGVVHLAFMHGDFSPEGFQKATAADRAAITAMAEVMEGSSKPLIICTGTLGYPRGQVSEEETEEISLPGFDRNLSSELIRDLSKNKGIRGMVMRLAPIVHGEGGDHGFVSILGEAAKKNGFAVVHGDGSARWTAVHRKDAAVVFRLAFEKGRPGATYLPIAEDAVATKDIMGAIGKKLNVPVESRESPEELVPLVGFLGYMLGADTPVTSEKTRKEFGWQPKEVGLMEDIAENYFN